MVVEHIPRIEQTDIMRITKKDAKLIIFLTILLIVIIAFGCFYGGIQYSKTRFIEQVIYELNQLLLANFSYVCGVGYNQYYLLNTTINLEGII